MKRRVLIGLVVALALLMAGALAAWAYVDDVVSVLGTFGAPTGSYSNPAVAESLVTGPPDSPPYQNFIQISDNSIVTLHVDPPISVDSNLFTSDLIIDTYDQPYPAAAKIEVSNDGVKWVEVHGPALNDCNLDRLYVYDDICPGLSPGDTNPSAVCQAQVDLTRTGLSEVSYVRMTDYPASIDGEDEYPLLGFDVDAMGEGHQAFPECQRIVGIDIKPGSDPNCFNSDGHGVIPVAILGSADFDASTMDPFTVSLNGAGVRVKGKSGNAGSLEDVNGDGFQDLVVQIIDDNVYTSGDTMATLQGLTYGGQAIVGTDSICIRPSVVDQENDPEATKSFGCGTAGSSLYQSFTPTKSPLVGVELRLRAGGEFPAAGVNTTINILSGDPTGTVLGTATAFVPGPQASMTQLLVHFGLSLTVTPGESVVIEWLSPAPAGVDAGKILTWMGRTDNPYPGGNVFGCTKIAVPDWDLNFRTFTK